MMIVPVTTTQPYSKEILLAAFHLDMNSSYCGYPICFPGNQPKFVLNIFPLHLSNLNFEHDLRQFMHEAEQILRETGYPPCPFVLHHLCLPLCPLYISYYCMNQRKSRLEQLMADFNYKVAIPKGFFVQWNSDFGAYFASRGGLQLHPGFEVKMLVEKRQEYCAKNGIPFDDGHAGLKSANAFKHPTISQQWGIIQQYPPPPPSPFFIQRTTFK